MSPIYGIWNVAAFIYDMSPLHRLRHLSSLTLSKDEFFNDLQMNHSGRIVREAEPSPFLKNKKGKLCHPLKTARKMSGMKAALRRKWGDAVKHICFRDAAYRKVHCRALGEGLRGRHGLWTQSPNNESSCRPVHKLFIVVFQSQQQLFSSSWLH